MNAITLWKNLIELLDERSLANRLVKLPLDPSTPTYGRKVKAGSPSIEALDRWLPSAYREFVTVHGYPALDLGNRARFTFLPPRVMQQVTDGMADERFEATDDGGFEILDKLRKKGTYDWPFAFFAGEDLSDINGWCFSALKSSGDPVVYVVEDSRRWKLVGTFETWVEKQVARAMKCIDSPAKAERLVRTIREEEGLEADEPLPKVSIASFGA